VTGSNRDCGILREIVGVKKKRGWHNVEKCGEMWTNAGKRGIGGYAGANEPNRVSLCFPGYQAHFTSINSRPYYI
jgi:hypothetical protein